MEIPLNLVIKLWVMASPLGYCIQFCPYLVKDSQLREYRDIGLGLGAAVVVHLAQFLPVPNDDHSEYHLLMDNFFTLLSGLLRHLQKSLLLRLEPCELVGCKILLSHRSTKLEKMERGSSDVAAQTSSNIAAIRCKDNKVVNVLSTYVAKNEQKKAKRYSQKEKKSIRILLRNVINVYYKYMGAVDRMDQNISCYMVLVKKQKVVVAIVSFLYRRCSR